MEAVVPITKRNHYYWIILTLVLLLNSEMTCVVITCEYVIRELGGPYFQMLWLLSSFLVGSAIGTILAPFALPLLGPKFGNHVLLLILALFSFLSAWPSTFYILVFYRLITGVFSAFLLIKVNEIVFHTYSTELFNKYSYASSLLVGFGNALGLLVGAYVSQLVSWRAVFMGFSGMYLVLFLLSFLKLPQVHTGFKPYGIGRAIFLSIAIASTQAIIDLGYQLLWFESPYLRALLYLVILFTLLFIVSELIYKNRLFPYHFLKDPNFGIYSSSMGVLLGVGLTAYMAFGVWLFNVLEYTGILTSTMLFVTAFPVIVISFFISKLLRCFSFKSLAIFGYLILVLLGVGIRYAFYNSLPFSYIALMRLIIGVCLGIAFPAITTGALSNISQKERGEALSFFTFIRLWIAALFMSGLANMDIYMTIFQQYNIAYASAVFSYGFRGAIKTLKSMQIPLQKGVAIITDLMQAEASVLSLITIFEFVVALGLFLTFITYFYTKKPSADSPK